MGPKSGNVGPSFASDITWERLILLSLTERVGSIVPFGNVYFPLPFIVLFHKWF